MSELDTILSQTKSALVTELSTGAWKPQPGDVLYECEFIRAGFRSWALEAPDKSWKLVLSRLDFGDSNPSALLTVYAPDNDGAFGDLDWYAFSHSVGVNGGTNYSQSIKRLSDVLGGSQIDWARRVTYLIGRARQANAGANNGTFSTRGVPKLTATANYLFEGRLRQGRTISIYGPGSAGKTTIVDGLVASACSGVEIIPGWRPARTVASLVLDWDEGAEEETIRLAAICAAYGIELGAGYHYKRQARPLYDVADEIGAYIVANGIGLVILSPMGRAQRSFGDNLTAPVDEVHEILRSFGTTNILIDHVTGDNMKGGATREFGSVRKRDNVRGSYAVDVQSEEAGQRVLVLRNTKADALMPPLADQAIRIEYDPPRAKPDFTYDRITFREDMVIPLDQRDDPSAKPTRMLIRDALLTDRLTVSELSEELGVSKPTIERVLYRYDSSKQTAWFNRLPSGKWELLPRGTQG
jgi:hypothetical protein